MFVVLTTSEGKSGTGGIKEILDCFENEPGGDRNEEYIEDKGREIPLTRIEV